MNNDIENNFSHPCMGVCSGWQQGYEKGLASAQAELERLRSSIRKMIAQAGAAEPLESCVLVINTGKAALERAGKTLGIAEGSLEILARAMCRVIDLNEEGTEETDIICKAIAAVKARGDWPLEDSHEPR